MNGEHIVLVVFESGGAIKSGNLALLLVRALPIHRNLYSLKFKQPRIICWPNVSLGPDVVVFVCLRSSWASPLV
jgi:hypothetical protein